MKTISPVASPAETGPQKLRALLARPELVVAPGTYDGIGARLVEQAGFAAVYMTGAGTAAARGYPDYGLLSLTEMVDSAATIARATTLPLIADADTGYGNELNVTRTVREYEARGVAGIHIEDQVSPKRCGHLEGKEVVSRSEFVSKIAAAAAARRDVAFVLIARTDSRAVAGLEEAVWRARAALEAGADVAFVEAAQSIEEVAAIPRLVGGPCLLNLVQGGKTPLVSLADAQAMGYRIAILPGVLLKASIDACDDVLAEVRRNGTVPLPRSGATPASTFRRFGADEWDAMRRNFDAAAEELVHAK